MKYTILFILTLTSYFSFGQSIEAPPPPDTNMVYQVTQYMPDYPGGYDAMMWFIKQNIQYPDAARINNVQGRVVIGFVVERDGSLTNVTIKKSVSPEIDKEAVRIVSLFPKFIPGKQQGTTVRVQYNIPIWFKL